MKRNVAQPILYTIVIKLQLLISYKDHILRISYIASYKDNILRKFITDYLVYNYHTMHDKVFVTQIAINNHK